MQVIPALDILDGSAVRLLQGDYSRVTVYDPDPVNVGVRWYEQGVTMIHVVDLEAARGNRSTAMETVEGLVGAGVPCQVGGGVRTAGYAAELVESGVTRVVVGSAFVDPGGRGEDIVAAVGEDAVVAAIDVRDGSAFGHGWTSAGVSYRDVIQRVLDSGVRRLLVTAIAVDGTMAGPDLELLRDVRSIDASIRVLASGGVGSIDDIKALTLEPVEGVIVGRALYEGRFTVGEAVRAATGT